MFTGIIEEIGKIKNIKQGNKSSIISVEAKKVLNNTNIGDSISTNGVCLTVTKIYSNCFEADVMPETFRKSNLSLLNISDMVNLERAIIAEGRFGGHIVSGHVDGTGKIIEMKREDNAVWVFINADKNILKYIVKKGSVAIDGISLTVADVSNSHFSVSIIPHTGFETTLLTKKIGDIINIENDIIAKYVEKLISFDCSMKNDSNLKFKNDSSKNNSIDIDFLNRNGFL